MNNYENEIFSFGEKTNNDLEQTNNLPNINGLGDSNYENEDLFINESNNTIEPIQVENNNVQDTNSIFDIEQPVINNPVETNVQTENLNSFNNQNMDDSSFVQPIQPQQTFDFNVVPEVKNSTQNVFGFDYINTDEQHKNTEFDNVFDNEVQETTNNEIVESPVVQEIEEKKLEEQQNNQAKVEEIFEFSPIQVDKIEEIEQPKNTVVQEVEPQVLENTQEDNAINFDPMTGEPLKKDDAVINQFNDISEEQKPEVKEEKSEIFLSETPIEELEDLTKYEEDNIEPTDINSLFNKVSTTFQDASDIFKKNTDMKAKIDNKFDELKKLQSELEVEKQKQLDEINKYKEEVLGKLTEKKEEIEKRLNTLKEYQTNLEKEKTEFEKYRKEEMDNIDKVQKEVQEAYDDRREELSNIEDALRKQKDSLDEERNQLSLDRIQYEADKNELANNLLKFNELVNSFTNGVNSAGRE